MPDRFAQITPPDIHIDFGALADAIWRSFTDHLPTLGQTVWDQLSGWIMNGVHGSADAVWNNSFTATATLLWQLPAALTYNLPAYQAVAANPLLVAVGGATLAIVLLGLRTMFGAMVGRDHVATHITGRLIPASAAAVGYVVLTAWTVDHINDVAARVTQAGLGDMMRFPGPPPNPFLAIPYLLLWIVLIWYGVKLMIRVAYGLFRFLVAMVFGPVAIVLWAIPQTEWITTFWIRELVGWGMTPILVAVCLAMAVPLALGETGFIGAVLFGIAGLKAASDLVGLFASSKGGGGGGLLGVVALARLAAGAVSGGAGVVAAGASAAAQSSPPAQQYGAN